MKNKLTFNGLTSSPNAFDDWFEEEKGTGEFELESDVDEVVEDDYSEDA